MYPRQAITRPGHALHPGLGLDPQEWHLRGCFNSTQNMLHRHPNPNLASGLDPKLRLGSRTKYVPSGGKIYIVALGATFLQIVLWVQNLGLGPVCGPHVHTFGATVPVGTFGPLRAFGPKAILNHAEVPQP